MPCVYSNLKFPEGTAEKEAVEYLINYSAEMGISCVINYRDFKTITIDSEKGINTTYHSPLFRITNSYLIPGGTGNDIGKVRIL